MKKIKFLIASMIGAIALVFTCVLGTKVNAETLNDVRTISSDGTKSSWNFASSSITSLESNYTISEKQIDYIDGMTNDSSKGAKVNKSGYVELAKNNDFYLSLPSSDSTGKFKFTCKDNITASTKESDQRTVTVADTTLYSSATEQEIAFNSSNVTTITGLDGYWLQINCNSAKAARIVNALIELTSGNYKESFTVNFYLENNASEPYATKSVLDGNTVSEWPANPIKNGFDFDGWKTTNDELYTSTTTITGDVDLYAQWIESGAEKVNVIFNSNGGSNVATQSVVVGKTASRPTDPTKDGFTFAGWFDSTLTNEYDFTSSVTAEITLYAKWVKALNKDTVVLGTFALTGSKDDVIISETSAGDFTLLATDNKNGSNYNQHFTIANGTTVNSVKYNLSLKTNGASSFDGKFRLIKFTADGKSTITAVSQSANSNHDARDMYLYDSIGNLVDSVTVTDPNSYELNVPSAGDYYIGCQNGLYFYDIKLEAETAVPTVSLFKDINADNNDEIRLVVKIDNLSIDGSNLNYIKNVKIEIEGTSYSKTVSKVYRAVDSATTGNYKKEDNVCYAVQSFNGYSNASSAFTFKVTVNYVGGSVVKTLEVPAYSA